MSGTMTNVIPSGAMQDSGSIEKFRAESKIGFTASGLVWSALTGLNATMTAGVQYTPDGLRRSISAVASRAFTVSKDTYISISPAGALSYQEVANNAAQPTLGTDFRWLAKVVTSASAITSVADMRQTAVVGSQNIDWATFALRQNNDTNVGGSSSVRMEYGWGWMQFSSAQLYMTEVVTFQKPFTTPPIVVIAPGGDAGNLPAVYGTGSNLISGNMFARAIEPTTTNFKAAVGGSGYSATNTIYYQWIAIGS